LIKKKRHLRRNSLFETGFFMNVWFFFGVNAVPNDVGLFSVGF
jgi:hypothetical protein